MKNFIIFWLILLFSCNNKQKSKEELSLLQLKSITLPTECLIINNTIVDYMNSDMKLVVYNDSIGCSTCDINKMYLWNNLIEYEKSCNGWLRYYFIYSPSKKDIGSFRLSINNSSFNYPILLDTLGDFERQNPHLPKNKAMHTFLLDENNKVILVGNPLHNKEIEKLFYKITQEQLTK